MKGNSRVGIFDFRNDLPHLLFLKTFAQSTYEKLSNESSRQIILQDLNEITDPEEFLQTQVFIPIFEQLNERLNDLGEKSKNTLGVYIHL